MVSAVFGERVIVICPGSTSFIRRARSLNGVYNGYGWVFSGDDALRVRELLVDVFGIGDNEGLAVTPEAAALLAGVSDDDLVLELRRRGFLLTVAGVLP